MRSSELPILISAIAAVIAENVDNNNDLAVISLAFRQLSYNLDLIIEQRIIENPTQDRIDII